MAFIDQIRRDVGSLQLTLDLIDLGLYRPQRNGRDITAETYAEALRRQKVGRAILESP